MLYSRGTTYSHKIQYHMDTVAKPEARKMGKRESHVFDLQTRHSLALLTAVASTNQIGVCLQLLEPMGQRNNVRIQEQLYIVKVMIRLLMQRELV